MTTWGIFKRDSVSDTFENLQLEAAVSTVAKAHGFVKQTSGVDKGSYKHPTTGETITALHKGQHFGHSRKDGSTVTSNHKDNLEKHLASHGYKKESVNEGWDDMLKSVKDKNSTQPNGGSGKKQGTRYGGGKQKDDEAKERKGKKNEEAIVDKEVEQIAEAIHADDYHATSEPSQFGGHRPIVKHKEKGTVMYAGGKSYSTAAKAKEGAHAYLSAYEKRGPNAAMSAAHEHGKAHGMKKEGFELFNERELDLLINEVLSKDASAGKWIDDFTKSDAPQFSGKSKEKRKQMALAAYYAAQKKESTDYESFVVLDEEKQAEIVKMGAKEIKHANMKDKQDDAEIMEPHSEGEANFIDQHYVNVTDDPTASKQDGGAGKLGKAAEPKGQGAATYKGDSKLSNKDKASYKEGTSQEGNTIAEEASSQESSGKKSFSSFKAKVTG